MKKVIITWVSEWLGYELAKIFLGKWFEVIGLSRTKPDLAITHIPTDLSSESSLEETINQIKDNHWEFSCMINCAGVLNIDELGDINYKKLENLFRINVLAPTILVSQLLELIKKNEADIVNVWSTVWFKAYEKQLAYWASKRAVRWINENLQLELKKTKCRVIGFNPWWFKSKLFEKATWSSPDLSGYMDPAELAKFIVQILELPKSLEVSEVIVNRK